MRRAQSWPNLALERVGTRRAAMMCAAVMHVAHGCILLYNPYPEDGWLIYYAMPLWSRIVLWSGTGIIAGALALLGPRRYEYVGWWLLLVMPLQRLFGHAVSFVIFLIPGGYRGSESSWALMLLWGAAVCLLWVLLTWKMDPLVNDVMPQEPER